MDVEALLQTLQSYQPLIDEGGAAALPDLSAQISTAETRLAERIDAMLDSGRSDVVVELLARQPELIWSLQRLRNSSGGSEVFDRFCRRLEHRLLVPPPAGFAQVTEDSIGLLRKLDSANPRAAETQEQLGQLTSNFVTIAAESFEAQELGTFPSNTGEYEWRITDESLRSHFNVDDREGRALAITSDAANAYSVSLAYEALPDTRALVVTCDVTVKPNDFTGETSDADACKVRLAGGDWEPAGLSCQQGRLGWCASSASSPVQGYGPPLEYGQPYHVELRYFSDSHSIDVLVNSRFLVEGQPHVETRLPTCVSFEAGYGCTVEIGSITVRAGATPLKRELGPRVPLIETDALGLSPARFLPLQVSTALAADIDGDGQVEFVTSGIDREPTQTDKSGAAFVGYVRACQFVGRDFRAGPPDTLLEWPARRPSLLGSFQGWLVVSDGSHLLALRAGVDINNGKPIADDCDGARTMTPFMYPHGKPGLAVGAAGSEHNRNLRFFAATRDHPSFQATGSAIAPVDEARRRSDIFSLASCDIAGDTTEELLIGWGPWRGYGPVFVTPSPENNEETVTRIGPPDARYGNTRLCVHRADDEDSYLVVASAHEPRLAGREFAGLDASATSGGIRVWCASHLRGDITAKPCWTLDVDARAVATGELCGQKVFVAAWLAPMGPDVPGHKLVIGAYGVSQGLPQELWLATFFDVPQTDPYGNDYQLLIDDLNGDGSNELIFHLAGRGAFIFANDVRDRAPQKGLGSSKGRGPDLQLAHKDARTCARICCERLR